MPRRASSRSKRRRRRPSTRSHRRSRSPPRRSRSRSSRASGRRRFRSNQGAGSSTDDDTRGKVYALIDRLQDGEMVKSLVRQLYDQDDEVQQNYNTFVNRVFSPAVTAFRQASGNCTVIHHERGDLPVGLGQHLIHYLAPQRDIQKTWDHRKETMAKILSRIPTRHYARALELLSRHTGGNENFDALVANLPWNTIQTFSEEFTQQLLDALEPRVDPDTFLNL